MTYEDFTENLLNKLDDRIKEDDMMENYRFFEDGDTSDDPEDLSFIRNTNIKYHKTESDVLIGDFLQILAQNGSLMSRFEMKSLYKSFQENGWDMVWEIINDNLKLMQNTNNSAFEKGLEDYEHFKDRLILRPLNFTDNKYELKNYLYRRVGDIALVLYGLITKDGMFGLQTFKIPKVLLEKWDKDFDEVLDAALINTYVNFPPRMYDNSNMFDPGYEDGAYMALESRIRLSESSIFTTYPGINGAISFFYPGVKEKIAQMTGEDYYIAFTGISDFHVHPISQIQPRTVLFKLKNMNKNANKPGEILSRKVFRYKVDTAELVMLEL